MRGRLVLLVTPFAASSSNNNVYSSYILFKLPFRDANETEKNEDAPSGAILPLLDLSHAGSGPPVLRLDLSPPRLRGIVANANPLVYLVHDLPRALARFAAQAVLLVHVARVFQRPFEIALLFHDDVSGRVGLVPPFRRQRGRAQSNAGPTGGNRATGRITSPFRARARTRIRGPNYGKQAAPAKRGASPTKWAHLHGDCNRRDRSAAGNLHKM